MRVIFIICCLLLKFNLFGQVLDYPQYKIAKYFPDTMIPVSKKEFKALPGYVRRRESEDVYYKHNYEDTLSLIHYLDGVRGNIDTLLMDSIRNIKHLKYKGVSLKHIVNILNEDALVKGKVVSLERISKQFYDKCLRYKTEYVIEVLDVVHAYPNIKVGDYVIVKDIAGYSGGCSKFSIPDVFESYSHHYEYRLGEVDYFIIEHNSIYLPRFYGYFYSKNIKKK